MISVANTVLSEQRRAVIMRAGVVPAAFLLLCLTAQSAAAQQEKRNDLDVTMQIIVDPDAKLPDEVVRRIPLPARKSAAPSPRPCGCPLRQTRREVSATSQAATPATTTRAATPGPTRTTTTSPTSTGRKPPRLPRSALARPPSSAKPRDAPRPKSGTIATTGRPIIRTTRTIPTSPSTRITRTNPNIRTIRINPSIRTTRIIPNILSILSTRIIRITRNIRSIRSPIDGSWRVALAALLIGFLLPVPAGAHSPEASQQFETGKQAFAAQDYATALNAFEGATAAGMTGPVVHFNIGVCAYRVGQWSRAAAAFRETARTPAMAPLAHYNLGLVAIAEHKGTSGEVVRAGPARSHR